MSKKLWTILFAMVFTVATPLAAFAASGHGLDGTQLSLLFVIPFVGMLLSIAICPLVAGEFWHHNFGKVAIGWALAFIIPCFLVYGKDIAIYEVLHIVLADYLPFIILLFALFTIAGGVRVKGALVGKPCLNTTILLIGTVLASVMGTTGAAMLLIRPILRANAHRKYKVHTVVFFIFLVANIGGSLTPLGDPPLFLGFLKGVPFEWTLFHMIYPMAFMSIILLALYFVVDTVLYAKEGKPVSADAGSGEKFGLEGKVNLLLLVGVVGAVLMSGMWKPAAAGLTIFGINITLPNLCRDGILLGLAALSWILTTKETRVKNDFNWFPIMEVAKIFIGIFITMIPALAILNAGKDGHLAPLVSMVTAPNGEPIPYMFFWITGLLSSFLDNAPTYVVFFTLAGGGTDLVNLLGAHAHILLAISCGAVFMGANTYIGNAPNFMVRSIAEDQGVKMPSFFGYMAWSFGILVPLFVVMTFIFFLS